MNILDRYIIRQFVGTWFFSIVALCVLFLIVNLLESLDEFIDQSASFGLIAEYYIYYLPDIIKLITPIAMLLATLFTFGRLTVTNETTAMKSSGLSLYRMMLPLVILSVFISFGQLYFNGWIVPKANEKKIEIERKYLNKGPSGASIYNLYFRDTPLKNIIMQYYNSKLRTGNKVAVEEFSSEKEPRLIRRVEAERIVWDSVNSFWYYQNGIDRIYTNGHVTTTVFDSMKADIRISHDQIISLKKIPAEMNFDELQNYINLLASGGKDVRKQRIDYYGQYAFPFANFIVVLFGVPFASVPKKGGIALQIGAAMVIAFLYLLFQKIGQTIGYSSNFDPVLSGWLANLIFFVGGIITIIRTRT